MMLPMRRLTVPPITHRVHYVHRVHRIQVSAKMGEGEVFGELAILSGRPRGASCTAMTDVQCLVLDGVDLEDVMAQGSSNGQQQAHFGVQLKYSSRIDAVTLMRYAHDVKVCIDAAVDEIMLAEAEEDARMLEMEERAQGQEEPNNGNNGTDGSAGSNTNTGTAQAGLPGLLTTSNADTPKVTLRPNNATRLATFDKGEVFLDEWVKTAVQDEHRRKMVENAGKNTSVQKEKIKKLYAPDRERTVNQLAALLPSFDLNGSITTLLDLQI